MPVILGRYKIIHDVEGLRWIQAFYGVEDFRVRSGAYPALRSMTDSNDAPFKLPEKSDRLKARLALRAFFVRSGAYPRLRLRG